jgi:hypothetical protein
MFSQSRVKPVFYRVSFAQYRVDARKRALRTLKIIDISGEIMLAEAFFS